MYKSTANQQLPGLRGYSTRSAGLF